MSVGPKCLIISPVEFTCICALNWTYFSVYLNPNVKIVLLLGYGEYGMEKWRVMLRGLWHTSSETFQSIKLHNINNIYKVF